jgi:hypothetical protein
MMMMMMMMMIQVEAFWVVMLCSTTVDNHCFGGLCCLHLQGEVHGARKWTRM